MASTPKASEIPMKNYYIEQIGNYDDGTAATDYIMFVIEARNEIHLVRRLLSERMGIFQSVFHPRRIGDNFFVDFGSLQAFSKSNLLIDEEEDDLMYAYIRTLRKHYGVEEDTCEPKELFEDFSNEESNFLVFWGEESEAIKAKSNEDAYWKHLNHENTLVGKELDSISKRYHGIVTYPSHDGLF